MLYVKIKADKQAILQKIINSRVFVDKGWVAAEKIARRKFNQTQGLFFREFMEHPVTQEILAGPNIDDNPSGLMGGRGNLFSFFGFDEGENPIADVSLYLQSQFDLSRSSYRTKQWTFKVRMPDKEKVAEYVVGKYGATYTSESWIDGVEKGYSGLNYYLRFSGKGRSSGGIQVKGVVNEVTFTTTKYMSELTENFKNRMQRSTTQPLKQLGL